jgi:hypothetical protein
MVSNGMLFKIDSKQEKFLKARLGWPLKPVGKIFQII